MTGSEIKQIITESGVKLWQVGAALGMNDGNFSRRLRKPFSAAEVQRIREIIAKIKSEQGVNE